MSIFGNLFKKKDDDFSFDSTDSFSPPPGSDSMNNADPFATPGANSTSNADPFGTPGSNFDVPKTDDPFATPQGTPDPFASTTTNNSFNPSAAQSTPLPPIEKVHDAPQSRGSQIAQDYLNRQQASTQNTPAAPQTNTASRDQNHNLEMINLKLDAIKSQLEMLNQRLQRVESEPKKKW